MKDHVAQGDRELYGNQWGNPQHSTLRYWFERYVRRRKIPGNLSKVVHHFIQPYVHPSSEVLEIGAGGGRWTQFLLPARRIVIVEVAEASFAYLETKFGPRFEPYLSTGAELDGIANESIDYVFSFGTLVHTPPAIIEGYVAESYRVLRPGGLAALQYADKSKPAAQRPGPEDEGFANMTGPRFETMAARIGFQIRRHDRRLLNHSNIVLLRRPVE